MSLVAAAYRQLKAASQPADKVFIAEQIARLSRHYGLQKMAASEAATVVADFIEDLADIPAWLIVEACRAWRNNPQNIYRPTPGQFRAAIRGPLLEHRRILEGLRRVADLTD